MSLEALLEAAKYLEKIESGKNHVSLSSFVANVLLDIHGHENPSFQESATNPDPTVL